MHKLAADATNSVVGQGRFTYDADPQWQLSGERLGLARDFSDLFGGLDIPGEEDDAAEIEFLRQRVQVRRETVPRESGKRDLTCMPAYVPNRHRRII